MNEKDKSGKNTNREIYITWWEFSLAFAAALLFYFGFLLALTNPIALTILASSILFVTAALFITLIIKYNLSKSEKFAPLPQGREILGLLTGAILFGLGFTMLPSPFGLVLLLIGLESFEVTIHHGYRRTIKAEAEAEAKKTIPPTDQEKGKLNKTFRTLPVQKNPPVYPQEEKTVPESSYSWQKSYTLYEFNGLITSCKSPIVLSNLLINYEIIEEKVKDEEAGLKLNEILERIYKKTPENAIKLLEGIKFKIKELSTKPNETIGKQNPKKSSEWCDEWLTELEAFNKYLLSDTDRPVTALLDKTNEILALKEGILVKNTKNTLLTGP